MNAELTPDDRFHEWLLSDHPGAAAERTHRRLGHQVADAEELARLRGWLGKIDRLAEAGQPLGDSVWRLAEQARTWLVPNAEKRLAELTGEPDRVRVRRGRQELETSQRVGGNHDYRYPARFLGAGAARQPIPPDPWTRLHDPEERPSLGDRAVQDLEAKNSPLDYVRTQAVTGRARIALERGQRQPPIHQLHGSRRAARPDQVRVERDEPDRER